jgi:branched-chain amino acid transport system ATP-binding protein
VSHGLRISGLTVPRQGFPIVRDLTLDAPAGEVTVLLGANGAGKTTLLEAISGLIPADAGQIAIDDTEIQGMGPMSRALTGLAHVEQGRHVFAELTVVENIEVAAPGRAPIDRAMELFPELKPRRDLPAISLSGGEQQMLVIARALARDPRVLLIDEMSLGLAPVIVQRLLPIVEQLAAEGVAVLLVEQYADLALRIASKAYVLSRGEIVLRGEAAELIANPDTVRDAYLGGGAREVQAPR